MGPRVNYSGLVIAGIGFFLTRFTVTLAIYDDPVRFYFAGVIPLALGLGLAAFGVALAIADVDGATVKTTATWCVAGTVTMSILAILTVLGSTPSGSLDLTGALSQSYLSNFLIGGSIGGTLTGLLAARNRRQRHELQQHTNRLVVLNRMLRHEVLNAITAIRGYASFEHRADVDSADVIRDRTEQIERTISYVKYLTPKPDRSNTRAVTTDLEGCLEASIDEVRDRHPGADISLDDVDEDLAVRADEQLSEVFTHLLENAILHAEDASPNIEVSTRNGDVRVSVSDTGPGLSTDQRALLENGTVGKFDDPKTGFGLNLVRLFVDDYGGDIETEVTQSGTTISTLLPRANESHHAPRPNVRELANVRPAIPHLLVSLCAALIAGLFYGITSEVLGGSVAGIGVFYGTADPIVGWITHEFHSIVFGFVFVGLLSLSSDRWHIGLPTVVGIAIGWALVLWTVAAGFVAPIWLQLLGIPAPIPNVSFVLLVSHLAWAVSLALLTAAGYKYVVPLWDRRFGQVRG